MGAVDREGKEWREIEIEACVHLKQEEEEKNKRREEVRLNSFSFG